MGSRPAVQRRAVLERVLGSAPAGLSLGPITDDVAVARSWLEQSGPSIDGVVAKGERSPYQPGVRGWQKIKRERTADCVVAGFRWYADQPVLSEDIDRVDELYMWFLRLKEQNRRSVK